MTVTLKSFRSIVEQAVLRRRHALAVLFLLCVLVYARTLDVPFTFDDRLYILGNPLIHDVGTVFDRDAVARANVHEDVKNNVLSRPLSYLTFAVNYRLHRYSVGGYHLANLAIHLANTFLAYALVLLCAPFPPPAAPEEGGEVRLRVAFFTAALFAVHPLMTNAVTYIIQRMASFTTLFYLLTMVLYATGRRSRSPGARAGWYAAALVSCVAAMESKEIAFTLPLMLAAYEAIFWRGPLPRRMVRLLPFLATMAIIPLTVAGLKSGANHLRSGTFTSSLNLVNYLDITPVDYLLTQFRVVATYLRMLLVPVGLTLEHDYRLSHSLAEPSVIAALLLHLALAAFALHQLRAARNNEPDAALLRRLSGFGILWFYLSLAVESSIIPLNDLIFEYRIYLPAFGFFVAAVSLVQLACRKMADSNRAAQAAGLGLWVAVVLFALLTIERNEVWRDPVRFWQDAVETSPALPSPRAWLGYSYYRRGDLDEAILSYKKAIALDPTVAQTHNILGNVYFKKGYYREAVEEYQTALRLKPEKTDIYVNLYRLYSLLGEERLAEEAREKARAGGVAVE